MPSLLQPPTPEPNLSPASVDLSLIDWMLSLTPDQRLDALEQAANDILELRAAVR